MVHSARPRSRAATMLDYVIAVCYVLNFNSTFINIMIKSEKSKGKIIIYVMVISSRR